MSRSALVVENDEPLRGLISAVLSRHGLEPEIAADAPEAVAQLSRDGAFDLIVLDLATQASRCLDVIQYLHQTKPQALRSVVGLTDAADVDVVQRIGNAGAFRLLRKPFELSELDCAVRACLGREPFPEFVLECLSCAWQDRFQGQTSAVARQLARNQGWHVVTFVRYVAGLNHELFVTFCPNCTRPPTSG